MRVKKTTEIDDLADWLTLHNGYSYIDVRADNSIWRWGPI